jgi:hypothetical protein
MLVLLSKSIFVVIWPENIYNNLNIKFIVSLKFKKYGEDISAAKKIKSKPIVKRIFLYKIFS